MSDAAADGSPAAARMEIAHAVLAFCALWLLTGIGAHALDTLPQAGATPTRGQLEAGLAVQMVASLAVLALSVLHPTRTPLRGRGRVGAALGIYVAFLLVWVPVAFVVVPAVWQAMGWPIEPQPHLEYFAGPLTPGWAAITVTAVCLVGPLIEEIIFRGYLQTGLRGLYGPRVAVFLSGLLFGGMHVGAGFHVLLPLAMIGWLLGWLRERSAGLLAPIVVHVLHNSLTVGLVVAAPEVLDGVYQHG